MANRAPIWEKFVATVRQVVKLCESCLDMKYRGSRMSEALVHSSDALPMGTRNKRLPYVDVSRSKHRLFYNLKTSSPRLLKSFVPAILEPVSIGIHNPSASNVDSSIGSSSHTLRRSTTITTASTSGPGAFPSSLLDCHSGGPVARLRACAAPRLAAEHRKPPSSGRFWSSRDSSRGCQRPLWRPCGFSASGLYCLNSTRRWWRNRELRVAEETR